jgi:DNA repair photolyase
VGSLFSVIPLIVRVREILSKAILTKTGIEGYDYCINPYVGCQHGCRYCYASFMKRFTGHSEPWGEFVDVKINAPQVLARQLKRPKEGSVLIGTVTDPYQPLEKKYRITRGCLEVLLESRLSLNILTRSPLVLRDIDLFKKLHDIEIGFSITTDSEETKKLFEPDSPSILSRVEALKKIHDAGIRTYVFIGPMLPLNPEKIVDMIAGAADSVLIDRLNYSNKVLSIYRRHDLENFLQHDYFSSTGLELKESLEKRGISVSLLLTE